MEISIIGLEKERHSFFERKLKGNCLNFVKAASECSKSVEVIVVKHKVKLGANHLKDLSKLKLIATLSTGFDNIDLNFCREKGVVVCNVPAYGENTVAEFSFALLLALARKINESIFRVSEIGKTYNHLPVCGVDLMGKTFGIIGTGRIGARAIKIAKGFGMKILAYDAYPNENLAKEEGFEYVALEKLLSSSDIISLYLPLNDGTYHILNENNIDKIRDGALLVNSARGELVETKALYKILKKGNIAGAALDVLEEERVLWDADDPVNLEIFELNKKIIEMPNVIVTPHNAYNSREGVARIDDTAIGNVLDFIKNKPVNIVS